VLSAKIAQKTGAPCFNSRRIDLILKPEVSVLFKPVPKPGWFWRAFAAS
jgi:hypothetical protein